MPRIKCPNYMTDITEIGVLRNHTCRWLCKQLKKHMGTAHPFLANQRLQSVNHLACC